MKTALPNCIGCCAHMCNIIKIIIIIIIIIIIPRDGEIIIIIITIITINNDNNCESMRNPSRAWAQQCLTRAFAASAVVLHSSSSSRRVHSPLWEDLPEASSYARIGSTRVLRGRPRNRLRRNRARGCSRISSVDRAASIGHFPCPRPEDRCRGGASVLRRRYT